MKVLCPIDPARLLRVGDSLTLQRKGSRRPHKGIDLFAAAGTPVLAPVEGRVLRVVNGMSGRRAQQRAGYFVDLKGIDGRIYRLLHLAAEILVKPGATARAGQPIGSVGARGTSGVLHAQPHLHFEIALTDYDSARQDYGERVDPRTVLTFTQAPTKEFAMADIDWKGILSTAIDIGGPLLGSAINTAAPGVGTAVATGLPFVKKYVVEPYVPGTSAQPTAPENPPAPKPPEQQTAMAVLQRKGWSPDEVQQHLKGPAPASAQPAEMPHMHTEQCAHVVHGVLQEAGWHPAARQAILSGPYAFADYLKAPQHVPDEAAVARLTKHNPDAILQANLHFTTERGGHAPALYHGTHEAQMAGLGVISEHPGRKDI